MARYHNKLRTDLYGEREELKVSYTWIDAGGREHGGVDSYENEEALLAEWEPALEDETSE